MSISSLYLISYTSSFLYFLLALFIILCASKEAHQVHSLVWSSDKYLIFNFYILKRFYVK